MKKTRFFLPLLAVILAVTSAFVTTDNFDDPDKVWFLVDSSGNATNPNSGIRSEADPYGCSGSGTLCARALSISQGEVSLNSGSTTSWHINSGYSTITDFDDEQTKMP